MKRLAEEAKLCLNNAEYLASRLRDLDHPCLLNKYSTTVWMKKPHDSVIEKWQLAVEADGAHVVVMQNVDRRKIDLFVADLAAASQDLEASSRAVPSNIGETDVGHFFQTA